MKEYSAADYKTFFNGLVRKRVKKLTALEIDMCSDICKFIEEHYQRIEDLKAGPIPDEVRTTLRRQVPAFARKIAPVYEVLKWKWVKKGTDGVYYIPKARDIRRCLYRLIEGLKKGLSSSTGGLCVWHDAGGQAAGIEFCERSTIEW